VLERIFSGGQTGVDRAALDEARAAGIACGGWCPRDRWAEDGPIPPGYPLVETPRRDPAQRTAWNVRDADATLVLVRGRPRGGTAATLGYARAQGRPLLLVDLERGPGPAEAARWLREGGVRVLNVAGPRESQEPGVYARARAFLRALLAEPRLPQGKTRLDPE
jgi:hypothetical protein